MYRETISRETRVECVFAPRDGAAVIVQGTYAVRGFESGTDFFLFSSTNGDGYILLLVVVITLG